MCTNDLEGVVAKRVVDSYDPRTRWLKIRNRDYTQKEGRGDLFNGPRRQGKVTYP
jgi:hypothetical protein